MAEKRYLLPDNPDPESDRCFIVYIPDEQRYFEAFLGSLTFLGTWTAWELDDNHTALIASQRWKQANIRKLDANVNLDCEFLEELIDNDMAIQVTNNVSCGGCENCGGGNGGKEFCINTDNPPRPTSWPAPEYDDDFTPSDYN